nr:LysR family transcriptional regulator [Nocardia abscessus]
MRQLEYFLAVRESGAFSAAAARLYVSQPSLSQQIRSLEKELGAVLLERGPHGLALTPAGRVFLPQAPRVLRAAEEPADAVHQVVEGEAATCMWSPCGRSPRDTAARHRGNLARGVSISSRSSQGITLRSQRCLPAASRPVRLAPLGPAASENTECVRPAPAASRRG